MSFLRIWGRGDLQQQDCCYEFRASDWLLVVVLSFGLNFNSLFGGFAFDDHEAILTNSDVRSDTPLATIFTNDFWGTPLSDPESHKSYRPLTILSFRLNRQIHGLEPLGYHLTNVLLHTSVCLLVLYVLLRAGIERDTARLAALLFTAHPIHTEAVANVVGRAEILSAFFYLLSFLSYLTYLDVILIQDHTGTKQHHYYMRLICLPLTILLSVVAMLCKEQGITILAVCMLYDMFVCTGLHLQMRFRTLFKCSVQSLLMCGKYIVVSLCMVVIVLIRAQSGVPTFVDSDNPASFSDSFLTRSLTYAYLMSFNAWLLIAPSKLCFDWSMGSIPLVEALHDWRNAGTLLTFAFFALLILKSFSLQGTTITMATESNIDHSKEVSTMISSVWSEQKNHKNQMLGIFLLAVPYVPASNLLFPVGFVVAERVLYLPSIGFCVLVSLGITKIKNMSNKTVNLRKLAMFGFYVLILLFSIKTVVRNLEWRDSESLSLSALKINPYNAKVHFSVGNILAQQGSRSCLYHYQEAIRLKPNYTLAWTNLGLVFLNIGQAKEAEECYRKALSIKSDHINANTNMGHMCRLQKRYHEALKHYRIVCKRRPSNPVIHYHIAWVLFEIGGAKELKESERELVTALQLHPNYGEAHLLLGRLLLTVGSGLESTSVRSPKAIDHLKRGILLTPKSTLTGDNYFWLGKALARSGKLEEAKTYLFKALQTAPEVSSEAQQELNDVLNKLSRR